MEYLNPELWLKWPHWRRRDSWMQLWIRTRPADDWPTKSKMLHADKKEVAAQVWKKMSEEERLADVKYWWAKWIPRKAPKKAKVAVEEHGMGGLRTTWLVSPDDYEFYNLYSQLRLANPESSLHRELMQAMRELPSVLDLWERVVQAQEEIGQQLQALEQSICLELSLDPTGPGILHTHSVETRMGAKPGLGDPRLTFVRSPDAYEVLGCKTDLVVNRTSGRHNSKSLHRLHAYTQTRKTGHLFCKTNFEAGKHFWMNHAWLLELWYVNKISDYMLERELVDNKHMCGKGLSLVREHAEARQRLFMEDRHQELKDIFGRTLTGWKEYKEGTEFRAQFVPSSWGSKTRFKFLVIVGPSRKGKTRWACHLFGMEKTLVVDCQGVQEPNLNSWRADFHTCLVLDEAEPKLVLNCKTLLQSGVEGTILYQSRCQGFARYFNMYMVPIVICTNAWIGELRHPVEGHPSNWLRDNSFVIRTDEPMWQ